MMEVMICIGSSCHLKGAEPVIHRLSKRIAELGLTERITLKGSFCIGDCENGVCLSVDGKQIRGISPENADAFFEREILPLAREK